MNVRDTNTVFFLAARKAQHGSEEIGGPVVPIFIHVTNDSSHP